MFVNISILPFKNAINVYVFKIKSVFRILNIIHTLASSKLDTSVSYQGVVTDDHLNASHMNNDQHTANDNVHTSNKQVTLISLLFI